ncbi:MAG: hypothetical protein RL693_1283 [Verrucomicrobiota bacterium]|jgi:sugar phosphate isomerase/epimerase
MQLGFVSDILPELSLENILSFVRREGFTIVEIKCWKALPENRRYTCGAHLDVSSFTKLKAESLLTRCRVQNVSISALEAYPIMLDVDHIKSLLAIKRFRKTVTAAKSLGLQYVSVFIGRDQAKSIDANWSTFLRICRPLVKYAAQRDVKICIKTSTSAFHHEFHPVGENLLSSHFLWRRLFIDIPTPHLGLDCDPISLIAHGMDPLLILEEFKTRIFTVHVKIAIADPASPTESGTLCFPSHANPPAIHHSDRIGWREYSQALLDMGYEGPVCIQIDGSGIKGPLEKRMGALREARTMLASCLSSPELYRPAYQSAIRIA